jgi:uncharacterized membrane protein YciS (DUF1049 family)
VLRSLVISTADGQLIIAFAYILNFGLMRKCTLSAYHFDVGIYNILCALMTMTLSVLIVRDYWRVSIAATLIVVLAGLIFGTLSRLV